MKKKNLTFSEMIAVSSMLFGMFFGAGNLIFPVHMGQLAGKNIWAAIIGFIITAVGLPLLGVSALGPTKTNSLFELSSKVSKGYGYFFTCALYLTIGPFFAIPRYATTSFTVGVEPMTGTSRTALLLFSAVFFALVLYFSLKPSKILTNIGKIINPAFLFFLLLLLIVAIIHPMGNIPEIAPDEAYVEGSFFNGFLEGYNTMDVLASLAFGIVVIDVIRGLGIEDGEDIAMNTIKSGFFSCLLMALIYIATCLLGAQSRGVVETSANGGIALAEISQHYFGNIGQLFLAVMVTLACLKTAIGLVTSISEAFTKMFSDGKGYQKYAIGFCLFSFVIANFGLNTIITYAIPVLMFLYPLAITLTLLGFFGNAFGQDGKVYAWVTGFALFAAIFDFFNALGITTLNPVAEKILPFFKLGLGWVVPSLVGLIIGLIVHKTGKSTSEN